MEKQLTGRATNRFHREFQLITGLSSCILVRISAHTKNVDLAKNAFVLTATKMSAKVQWMVILVFMLLSVAVMGLAQPGSDEHIKQMQALGGPMEHPVSALPFYRERTFLVLSGLVIGGAGFLSVRIVRRRWRESLKCVERESLECVEFVSEAVLVVDLVNSTHLATHHGEFVAMNATNTIKQRILAAAEARGLTFAGDTGDGYFMTFPSVAGAAQTAIAFLTDLKQRPPDLSPGPRLDARVGISYGQILLDPHGSRHGVAINKAFRIEGISRENFAQLEGEREICEVPDRNRIFIDEEAAQELRSGEIPLRLVGFCRLKGFSGLHRIFEVLWRDSDIAALPSFGE